MTQATPRFLGPKKARATKPASATANGAATQTQDQPMPAQHGDAPKGKAAGKRTVGKAARGKQSVEAPSAGTLAIVAQLRALASRPDLLDAVEGIHPGATGGAVVAMVRSAQTAGPSGVADRAALWRVLGMPWIGEGGGKMAKDLGAALGAAYGEAVARLEGHRRQDLVTLDHDAAPEAAEIRHP